MSDVLDGLAAACVRAGLGFDAYVRGVALMDGDFDYFARNGFQGILYAVTASPDPSPAPRPKGRFRRNLTRATFGG